MGDGDGPAAVSAAEGGAEAVYDGGGFREPFSIGPFERIRLLNGLDEIGMALTEDQTITAFEERRPRWRGARPSERATH